MGKNKCKFKGVDTMNSIKITGRLTADAVVKETKKGEIVTFTIADQNPYVEGSKAQFVNVALLGKQVEEAKGLKKGDFVTAYGFLRVSRVEKDGKHYVNTNVILHRFEKPQPKATEEAPKA